MTGSAAQLTLPVRPWRPLISVSAALLAGLLLAATLLGPTALVLASAVVMACLVAGWVLMLDPPSYHGTTIVLALGAVAVLTGGSRFGRDGLLWLSASVAFVTLMAFVHQLTRRDGRPRLVESISATVTGIVLLSSGASLLPATLTAQGRTSAAVILAAVSVASVADVGIRWDWSLILCAALSVLLGGLAGTVTVLLIDTTALSPLLAALVGGLAAGSSHAIRQVQSVLPRLVGRRAQIASAAASILAVGLFTHVASWLAVLLP